MTRELEVLRIVGGRLEALGLRYMLTGSFAMSFYATPRMTRDLDVVVEIGQASVAPLVAAFSPDFYIDGEAAHEAILRERLFNLMHLDTGLKVDLIVCKDQPYRRLELERRCRVEIGAERLWVVSREDLILSKLVWMKAAESELQRRDVQALWCADLDLAYLRHWAGELTVADELSKIVP